MAVRSVALMTALWLAVPVAAAGQQVADEGYDPRIEQPSVAAGHVEVAIDGGHRNFHRLGGRYAPFGRLLTADGYRVAARKGVFGPGAFAGIDILVIANARGADGAAAFAPGEVAAVKAWVEQGGSLLLIADHAPFGDAAAPLAAAFGVDMGVGYAVARQDGAIRSQIEFSKDALGTHPILAGRGAKERVRRVQSFTGQSLGVPVGAAMLLRLPDDTLEVAGPEQVRQLREGQSVPGKRVGGRAQAVALTAGQGRVVIAGEAAMFTAQRMDSGKRVGLSLFDNQQFALNVLHWLSRDLD
jgi:hypothetical protein